MIRIDADRLLPGDGPAVADASVVLDGGVIAYAGPRSELPPELPTSADEIVDTVLPGLWDCHAHFVGLTTASLDDLVKVPPPVAAARAAKDAEAALAAGFTSIREAGGLGVFLARVVEEGLLVGPSIYAPGAILSQTGGHGDIHSLPGDWVDDYSRRDGLFERCDGVPECLRAVRRQLRRGARVIKVCASGGATTELDSPSHQQFSDEELRAIVEEAGRAERVVMAHAHGRAGIAAALDAGCHTIEHGSYLDAELAAQMREQGAILVPTRFIIERLLGSGAASGMPDTTRWKLEALAASHAEAVALAHEAGVSIALGTDIFMSGSDRPVPWGRNAHELELMVGCGLSPLEALATATANAPATLGPQAPKSGRLVAGFDADVLAVRGDPAADVSVLASPGGITHVWKAGQLVAGSELRS